MKFTIKEIRFKDYKSFKGDYISLKPEKFTLLICLLYTSPSPRDCS